MPISTVEFRMPFQIPILDEHTSILGHRSSERMSCIYPECRRLCPNQHCQCKQIEDFMPTTPVNPFRNFLCHYCQQTKPPEERHIPPARIVPYNMCNACFTRLIFVCPTCHNEVVQGDRTSFSYGEERIQICRVCFNRTYYCCVNCNAIRSRELQPGHCVSANRLVCEACVEHYTECENCGRLTYHDEVCYDDEDEDHNHPLCGNCMERPRLLMSDTFNLNPFRRKVGFEIEFCSRDEPNIRSFGQIKGDGSIMPSSGDYGYEFASHITQGDKLFEIIGKVCNRIRATGGYVNSSCGVHVHLDMNGSTVTQRNNITSWWGIFERIFFGMVAPSRRNNQYTRSVGDRYSSPNDRYRTLNTSAFSKFGTYEIRVHQGSLSSAKLKDWTLTLLSFFETFQDIRPTEARFTQIRSMNDRELLIFFFQQIKIPRHLQKNILKRIRTYNGKPEHQFLNLAKKGKI